MGKTTLASPFPQLGAYAACERVNTAPGQCIEELTSAYVAKEVAYARPACASPRGLPLTVRTRFNLDFPRRVNSIVGGVQEMEIEFKDWPNFPYWQQARINIGEEIGRACGTDAPDGICFVSPGCGGRGVVIAFRETSSPSPVIGLGDEWQEPGLVERIIRGVLLVLRDPRRIEREMLTGGPMDLDD